VIGLDPRGLILRLGGQYSLRAVHHENGVKLVERLGVVHKLKSTKGTSVAHFSALVLSQAKVSRPSWVRIWGFRPCSIIPFDCLTCPFVRGVSVCCTVYLDLVIIIEVQELLFSKLGAIVGDDGVGDPKVEDNVLEKAYILFGANYRHGLRFDPLSEHVLQSIGTPCKTSQFELHHW
jgi:hypothetical protein